MDNVLKSVNFEELFEQFCEEYVKEYDGFYHKRHAGMADIYFHSYFNAREKIARCIYGDRYEPHMMVEFYEIIEDLDWPDKAKDKVI
jgi:hypothetical protein